MESKEGYNEIIKESKKKESKPNKLDKNQAAIEVLKKFISLFSD